MVKNIIFDFDGTLCDTSSVIVRSFQETLVRAGYPIPEVSACLSVIGLSLYQCFTSLLGCSEAESHRLGDLYAREVFPKNVNAFPVHLFPSVMETLEIIKQKNIPMSIATSREKESAWQLINKTGAGEYMEHIVTPQEVSNGKPYPDMVFHLLKATGLKATETLVVGDAPFDIEMGTRAGCMTCAVTYGNGKKEDLLKCHPTHVIDNISDLLHLL